VKYRFEQCLQRGKTVRIPVDREQVVKELREAEQDLAAAEHSFTEGNIKWAIIQGYYAQFHALRAPHLLRGIPGKWRRRLRMRLL
jgi:uncharacterized protein (UPF0332 family)